MRCTIIAALVFAAIQAIAARLRGNEPLAVVAVLHHDEALCRPHDIEVRGSLVFVPGKGGSIALIDVASPERPRLLWWKRDRSQFDDAQTVLLWDQHLLLGSRDLYSIDIGNPSEPRLVGRVSDRPRVDRINGMVRRGDFAFSANKSGWVSVFDLRNPAAPVLHDVLSTRQRGGLISPHDIASWDDYIAVVDQANNSPVKLRVYRVADRQTHRLLPADQWQIAGMLDRPDLNGANRIVVAGGYGFVACSQQENFTLGFVDLRDPEHPRHLKTLPFADVHPTGLTVAGRVLFAAGGQAIQVLDVSQPQQPRTLAVFKSEQMFPTGRDNAHDLVYRNGYLYVTAQNDNQIGIVRVQDERIRVLADGPQCVR